MNRSTEIVHHGELSVRHGGLSATLLKWWQGQWSMVKKL